MSRRASRLVVLLPLLFAPTPALAQAVLHGRLIAEDAAGDAVPLTAVLVWANPPGEEGEGIPFRTWETHPSGWYRLACPPARYSVLFSTPHQWARPRVVTNVPLRDDEDVNLDVQGRFWLAAFPEKSWDPEPARGYYQTFTARGASVTQVGFKLATDGVDGPGPGGQDFLISIHRVSEGEPTTWEQIGPTVPVLSVDCGGAKSYAYSAGFRSGEVPTEVGAIYAVWLRPAMPDGRAQAFWADVPEGASIAYRVDMEGAAAPTGQRLWMTIAGDGDGLLLSANKRVHKPFPKLTHLERRWCQTWRAKGRSLAGVVVYAAVSGAQPPLARQRVRMTIREGGPDGRMVGAAKIATGNGDYTGDASWGAFGASWAPGETPLVPGNIYCLDVESIETRLTLDGFVNIKGQVSDGRAGFNPYRKAAPDDDPDGQAFRGGRDLVDYDLDLQVVEYEHAVAKDSWMLRTTGDELLVNRDADEEAASDDGMPTAPAGWKPFSRDDAVRHLWLELPDEPTNRALRLRAGEDGRAPRADGGWVQRVEGLKPSDALVLRARVRSSFIASDDREARVGIDPTGQTEDPDAPTIEWTPMRPIHGIWAELDSRPVRPQKGAVSVWLRLTQRKAPQFPYFADFDDLSLRRLDTGAPGGGDVPTR